jgi:hypothetical protein
MSSGCRTTISQYVPVLSWHALGSDERAWQALGERLIEGLLVIRLLERWHGGRTSGFG